jgi:hypothetical protein
MFAKALTQAGNFSWRQLQRGDPRTFFDETLDQRQAKAGAAASDKDHVIA